MILSKVYEDAERKLERNEITIGEFERLVDIEVIEPKQGEWIALDDTSNGYWKCSVCETPTEAIGAKELYKFCPFCNADMRGKDDE